MGNDVNQLHEKQKKLSQALGSKLTKERHLLNLRTKCRILDKTILSLEKSGPRPEDKRKLADAIKKRDRVIKEIDKVSKEISGLKADITDLQKATLELIVPSEMEVPAALVDGSRPVLLFPVRLETRFFPVEGGSELRIRIYPDDIAIQTHEPSITEDEYEAGCHYIRRIWWAGKAPYNPADDSLEDEEKKKKQEERQERWDSAWLELAGEYGPERAAWIVRKFRPF